MKKHYKQRKTFLITIYYHAEKEYYMGSNDCFTKMRELAKHFKSKKEAENQINYIIKVDRYFSIEENYSLWENKK